MEVDSICVVVVNYNAGALLRHCVRSVLASSHQAFTIVIVDNASTDDSLEALPDDSRVVVLRQRVNLGFAKAVNTGLKARRADWYLILNPDTRVQPDTLAACVEYMHSQPDIGVLGVGHTDDTGQLVPSNSRVPTTLRLFLSRIGVRRPLLFGLVKPMAMSDVDPGVAMDVDQVMGAYMFVRGSVVDELSILMDEDYFVYYEDVQFCKDVRSAGYRVTYDPSIRIYHMGQGTTRDIKAARLVYSVRSSLCYADKNLGWGGRLATRIAAYMVEPLARLGKVAVAPSRKQSFDEWRSAYGQIWLGK